MSNLPPNLPDERTAQRLLDLLAQLESLGPAKAKPSPTVLADAAEVATLRAENAQLRRRQQSAKEKLNALASKLEQLPSEQSPEQEAAA